MHDFIIYCDLDGVLVDLAKRMKEFYGEELNENNFKDKIHELMKKLNMTEKLDFWANLEKTSDCMDIWNFIKQFDPFILTSYSGISLACIGKKYWCLEHINVSANKIICVKHSFEKQKYAGSNKILIDDLKSNIEEWESKGGIGILHKTAKDTLKLLKSLLYTKYDTYDI
jgi:hypothetical protein